MNTQEFREFGHAAIEYIAEYMETIRSRQVLPNVEPGYLSKELPNEIPKRGEHWQKILRDFDQLIMPGMTHWQSPNFHAFFPSGSSYPSLVGDIFSAGMSVIGLNWTSSPVCTELEVNMMNWLGKLLNLPDIFLNSSPGSGGGVLQSSITESTVLCLLATRAKSIKKLKKLYTHLSENEISDRLIVYTSDQANPAIEKSVLLTTMKIRIIPTDENGILQPKKFAEIIRKDENNGLFPCCMIATLGSTSVCAFDQLDILGPICQQSDIWLHVDAAYAGAAFILPEYQYLLNGIEFASSFCFNVHKWLLVHFGCTALWLRNANDFTNIFTIKQIYLKDTERKENTQLPEYRNWQIPLGRNFRSLKLWFTLKAYGKDGLQAHIRNHINLAHLFTSLVKQNPQFELAYPTIMGLVCFRLKGDNQRTQKLHDRLMERKIVYVVTSKLNGKLLIRFVICSSLTNESDIYFAWNEITSQTQYVLMKESAKNGQNDNNST